MGHSAYAQISARQGAVSDREGRAHLATPWHADPNVSHAAIADAASATGIEVQNLAVPEFFRQWSHLWRREGRYRRPRTASLCRMAMNCAPGGIREPGVRRNRGIPGGQPRIPGGRGLPDFHGGRTSARAAPGLPSRPAPVSAGVRDRTKLHRHATSRTLERSIRTHGLAIAGRLSVREFPTACGIALRR